MAVIAYVGKPVWFYPGALDSLAKTLDKDQALQPLAAQVVKLNPDDSVNLHILDPMGMPHTRRGVEFLQPAVMRPSIEGASYCTRIPLVLANHPESDHAEPEHAAPGALIGKDALDAYTRLAADHGPMALVLECLIRQGVLVYGGTEQVAAAAREAIEKAKGSNG